LHFWCILNSILVEINSPYSEGEALLIYLVKDVVWLKLFFHSLCNSLGATGRKQVRYKVKRAMSQLCSIHSAQSHHAQILPSKVGKLTTIRALTTHNKKLISLGKINNSEDYKAQNSTSYQVTPKIPPTCPRLRFPIRRPKSPSPTG